MSDGAICLMVLGVVAIGAIIGIGWMSFTIARLHDDLWTLPRYLPPPPPPLPPEPPPVPESLGGPPRPTIH